VSRLRARCPDCRTLTAVAVDDGYECHACGAAFAAGLVRVPSAWGSGGEDMIEAARLPLPYPEVGTIEEETLVAQSLALVAALPVRPIVLGGCCCAHVGAVEGLAARGDGLGVVWLDAHGDLNTPETSPSGNAWGMPLRMLIDAGAVPPERIALVGARSLDPGERAFITGSPLSIGIAGIESALADADSVYIALDCDVLDPGEGVAVFMPEPDGLSIRAVEGAIQTAVRLRPLVGAGLTGLRAAPKNTSPLARLCEAMGLGRPARGR
jgi:arginase